MLKQLKNYKGGLIAVAAAVVISAIAYFIAFMAAFGNDTSVNRLILDVFGGLVKYAHPFWSYPVAYIIGAYAIKFKKNNY